MGLDCYITKKPPEKETDVKYWRKNWIIQYLLEADNSIDVVIDIGSMEQVLAEISNEDTRQDLEGALDRYDKEWWDEFIVDIKDVIADMKANETYTYIYNGDW